ncbi:RNA methyltransferase, TrmH family protein [Polaribacter irgensii 23-P]|uniref:RNA methyltransferase, TrmH family protein n=1 Tax=Polaribacter irgensii 23-P TaxID=313594 RepID=A4BYD2_9FLAO|nr:RNA methyltransferase [Polaribacter irgensii]EAR13973.1 RNA methyltransferase, TrmH family protein [Polaribacter irgensii 23-P]
MSISKSQLKLITSLSQKKYRQKHNLFIAEGIKVVNELLQSDFEVALIFCTNEFKTSLPKAKIVRVSETELNKISSLKSPNKVLSLFKIPEDKPIQNSGLILALDAINDPGNLGTIIRLCDWFGISQLICSKDTVDCYNQKVVQASMGSLTRISIQYLDLKNYLDKSPLPTFIADMNGENIYKTNVPKEGILVMGNEANGVSEEIKNQVQHKISIPRFGETQKTESLNVAMATAILISEFKRDM